MPSIESRHFFQGDIKFTISAEGPTQIGYATIPDHITLTSQLVETIVRALANNLDTVIEAIRFDNMDGLEPHIDRPRDMTPQHSCIIEAPPKWVTGSRAQIKLTVSCPPANYCG